MGRGQIWPVRGGAGPCSGGARAWWPGTVDQGHVGINPGGGGRGHGGSVVEVSAQI
jgi:hypothetical protein